MTDSSSSIDLSQDDNINKGTTFGLGLDIDENHALRFLSLPVCKQLLAYGGDTGEVFCILDNNKGTEKSKSSRLVRRWEEDAVRCMAASPSGQYIAVGLEDGSTQIYIYPKRDITATFHPFVGKLDDNEKNKDEEEEEETDTLLSQSDTLLSPRRGENMVHGPRFSTPNKDMLFLNEDYLGIAHEEGFCIVAMQDVTAKKPPKHYLEEEQKDAHRDSGCRGLAWMPPTRTLVSLAMDGHACYWDLNHIQDPSQWKLLKREATKAITKKDAGEMLDDGDFWGRSCRPALDLDQQLLALPGEPYWQIRTILDDDSAAAKVVHEQTLLETTLNGHVESMVVLRSSPHANDPYWVSTGRDGRVIVWKAIKVRIYFLHPHVVGNNYALTDSSYSLHKIGHERHVRV
jgi:WD40 repeat protein